ncbi:unnamed protein product [marine sediment metagenome]|uniref:Uncharacterized protein n=1 Tax=marine sediment metagenome TaxID=412755 RepID=X1MCH2_9ZZZZ
MTEGLSPLFRIPDTQLPNGVHFSTGYATLLWVSLHIRLTQTLDVEIAYEQTENHDLWLGHEGIEYAIEVILERAEKRIEKLKKCRNWSEEKFHRKFLWIL